ncbi:class F sortase [Blastococcus goldschmidtiae]|uniref:Class F sortase n=1 Tax=Blastococcus goldschmidtiae TaxID=3075546 RepID=A0ABU2K754_9ACTN|nr:class F sortase [Blastococcus sp. DSM 46792]MDT0276001.1 class F sortase [Blastococcus sp. DSM 46792]
MFRPARRAAALSGAAALGLGGLLSIGVGLAGGGTGDQPAAATEMVAPALTTPGSAPVTAPAPAASPLPSSWSEASQTTARTTARPTPSSSVHLVIDSVGLDLPLLPLTPRKGVIDPPTLTAGYWIEPYGGPVASAEQATNTLYVAAHSAGRGGDGFDPLLTADHRGGAVTAGDEIEIRTAGGTVTYTVEATTRYDKDQLAGVADVWESVPGRLVLITCFQRADGRAATENLVVFAHS